MNESVFEEIISKLEADSDGFQSMFTTDEVKKAINMALVFSHNICSQISDEYNGNDQTTEATVAAECCKAIMQHIDKDLVKAVVM